MTNTLTMEQGRALKDIFIALGISVKLMTIMQRGLLIIMFNISIACGIDTEAVAPAVHPSELISFIESEFKTYNLSTVSPYDTVSLNLRGVSGSGKVLDLPVSFYYDSQYVSVTADGVLKAKTEVASTKIIASMSTHGATKYDTILVSVVGAPPRHLSRVAIEPEFGDSAKITILMATRAPSKSLRLVRDDSSGATVAAVLVSIHSSERAVATAIQSGNSIRVAPTRPGRTMLRVSTFAYGVGFRDSLAFTTGWPLISVVNLDEGYVTGSLIPVLSLSGTRIIIGIGGCVVWRTRSMDMSTNILFDDPSLALPADSATTVARATCKINGGVGASPEGSEVGGDIPAFKMTSFPNGGVDPTTAVRTRAFTKPGTIIYRSSTYNFVGTIIVCDEKNDPTCAPENYKWGIPNNE